jgi:hypothetical protein
MTAGTYMAMAEEERAATFHKLFDKKYIIELGFEKGPLPYFKILSIRDEENSA